MHGIYLHKLSFLKVKIIKINQKSSKEKSFVKSYTLKFLLGKKIDIPFMEDIVETIHKIIKMMHIFTN